VQHTLAAAAAIPSLDLEAAADTAIPSSGITPVQLQHGEQQLRCGMTAGRFGFQNFLRVGSEWRAATLPAVPLISGPSFALSARRLQASPERSVVEGEASGRALDGTPLPYTWNAEVRAMQLGRGAAPWFRFQAWLHLPKPLRLDQGREVEPQIVLWLNRTSGFLEGQSLSWRRVLLTQPTRNSLGAWGNDLPVVYLQDANTGIETMMFFDLGAMSWMSSENVPRLLAYRCTTHVQLDAQGHQHRGIGLVTEQATGDVLPAGVVGFNFWLLQRANPRLVTEPEGVTRWMEALLPIFPESLSARPAPQKSWQTMAEGTVEDWQDPALAQVTIGSTSDCARM